MTIELKPYVKPKYIITPLRSITSCMGNNIEHNTTEFSSMSLVRNAVNIKYSPLENSKGIPLSTSIQMTFELVGLFGNTIYTFHIQLR